MITGVAQEHIKQLYISIVERVDFKLKQRGVFSIRRS